MVEETKEYSEAYHSKLALGVSVSDTEQKMIAIPFLQNEKQTLLAKKNTKQQQQQKTIRILLSYIKGTQDMFFLAVRSVLSSPSLTANILSQIH